MKKSRRSHWPTPVVILIVGAMGLLGVATSADEDDQKKPPTPLEQMRADLTMVQKLLKNASIKLNNDIMGSASGGASADPVGPVQQCCSQNLERIDKHLVAVREILSGLGACYEKTKDVEAATTLEQVHLDMRSLADGLMAFGGAKSRSNAIGAYQGIGQSWNQLQDDVRWLRDCPPTSSGSSTGK